MPYLNLDPNFSSHPKAIRLNAKLGENTHLLLVNLWSFAAKFHPKDGNLSTYTTTEIESFSGWSGEKNCFYNACVEVKFIDVKRNGKLVKLHDWKEHQGHLESLRLRAKNAAKKRWTKIVTEQQKRQVDEPQGQSGDAPGMPQAMLKNKQAMLDECSLPSLPSSPSLKDTTVGRSAEADCSKELRKSQREEQFPRLLVYFRNFPFSKNMDSRGHYGLAGWLIKRCLDRPAVATELLHARSSALSEIQTVDGFHKYINTVIQDPETMGECESAANKIDDGTKRGGIKSIKEIMEE